MQRTALVIGANGGMGAAVLRLLSDEGWNVAATVSRQEAVQSLATGLPACAHVQALDLADAETVRSTVMHLIEKTGEVDAVIVCAAVAPFAPAETTSFDVFRQTMAVNCLSNLAIYQASLPALRRSRGRLILTGSYSGVVATPMMTSYVASKFALEGLADVLRQEAGGFGVHVVLLQPGALDTQMMRRSQATLAAAISRLPRDEDELYGDLYRQMKYRADEGIANARFSAPADVARVVLTALEAEIPEPRYPIGDDAVSMVDLAKRQPHRAIDQFILDMYRSAPISQT